MKTLFAVLFLLSMLTIELKTQWNIVDATSTYNDFEAVYFTDVNTGYAAGYVFWPELHPRLRKTTDAGQTWFTLNNFPPEDTAAGLGFRSIFFTDLNTGYIAGGNPFSPVSQGMILKTTNGGNSWYNLSFQVFDQLNYIYFINSNTGFATGYQTLLKTTNAGVNWSIKNSSPGYQFQIHFTDLNTGYYVGNSGGIYKTTDCGESWFSQNSGTTYSLWGVSFSNANTGIIGGGPGNGSANIILRTSNGGENWTPVYNSNGCYFWRVRFVSPSTFYAPGACNLIFRSTDFGLTWCNTSNIAGISFRDVAFTSTNTGYMVGNYGSILKTTNGGGNCIVTGIEPANYETPSQYQLHQNYPNPFNPATTITFALPENSHVKLTVFDVLGREVQTLVDKDYLKGIHEVNWNASDYPSGAYFFTLQANEYKVTKKMLLIK